MSDSSFATMQQLPGTDSLAHAQTPLASMCGYPGVSTPANTLVFTGIELSESGLLSYLVLRGDAGDESFSSGVASATGANLPGPLQSSVSGDICIRWAGPDEWLITAPGPDAFALENKLRQALGGHYAVVNGGGGLTTLRLKGKNVSTVLKKSTPYDVHDRHFPVGKVVATVFAKAQATIRRVGDDDWELVIRRSFAQYIWAWLLNACTEFKH